MSSFESLEDFYRSLIQQCITLPERNDEMETSIFQSLFYDQRYDLILEGLKNGMELTPDVESMIIDSGNLKLYQYLFSQKGKLSFFIINSAIKTGNLETVIWLIQGISKFREFHFELAIINNQVEIAKWMHSQGLFTYSETIWMDAINNCNQSTFDFLIEIFPLSEVICEWCVVKGKLELLKWFRSHNCPWNRELCLQIARSSNLSIAEWIESVPN